MNYMYQQEKNTLINGLKAKGITNPQVLDAFAKVPREKFVSPEFQDRAYDDYALPIESGQTISQPYIVALMTQALLAGGPLQRVLEVGTGSAYQAAILSICVPEVYSVERIKFLHEQATQRLKKLNVNNVHLLFDDGGIGWPEHSPYDGIIVTAAAKEIPQALLDQLADGGRMVIPLGDFGGQQLCVIKKRGDQYESEVIESVIFVPLLSGKEE